MAERVYPPGIDRVGNRLRIRIYKKQKVHHTETLEGDFSKAHVARALKRLDQLKARLKLGLPLVEPELQASTDSFLTVAQAMLTRKFKTGETSRATSIEYERALNRYWIPVFGKMAMVEITTAMIKARLAEYPHLTIKTVKNILTPLREVFHEAEFNPTPVDPVLPTLKQSKKAKKKKIERYLPDERAALINAMRGPAQVFAALMFAGGFRPQELLALRRHRWDGAQLYICEKVTRRRLEDGTKTDWGRRVFLPTWARPFLERQLASHEHEFVFVNQYGQWHKKHQWFADAWLQAHQEIALRYRHPYVARHTRAAELLSIPEVKPAEAVKQLGHSVQMFLNTYSEWIDEYAQKDFSKLEGVGIGTTGEALPNNVIRLTTVKAPSKMG